MGAIGERFGGTVEMDALRVSVFPRLRVAGDRVQVRFQGRTDVPPLVEVKHFSAEAGVIGLLGKRIHLKRVTLEGLEVNVPPGGMRLRDSAGARAGADHDTVEPAKLPAPTDAQSTVPRSTGTADTPPGGKRSPIVIDELLAGPAVVRILRREAEKPPREFAIERLQMHDTGADYPWAFTATLTNPTPPGRIDVDGTFGPWNADTPSQTPLGAKYVFSDADLGVFKGIAGTLQSTGAFDGVLDRIDVKGTTDVPDFALADVGQAVPLKAAFHSIVDATNGNTLLEPVDAVLGSSKIVARGGVVEVEGQKGRTVRLDVVMERARLEDVLRLAVKTKDGRPPMTAALNLKTTLELPPGSASAMDKLRLDGTFRLDDARFSGGGVQTKVNELSRKAQGDDGPAEEVASDFTGAFRMNGGVLHFSSITFTMPGTRVDMTGTYTLASKAMDFNGTVRIDAKISELTSGAKSMFLKLVDPIFRRNGRTVIPITVGGTADDPKIGLDVARAFTPK